MNLLIGYPKCTTCKKAERFLRDNNIQYEYRNIKTERPTREEIGKWLKINSNLKFFFNTSGIIYRDLNLKEKLKYMSDEEQIELLASEGMLVRRPILVTRDKVYLGFKEKEWNELTRCS